MLRCQNHLTQHPEPVKGGGSAGHYTRADLPGFRNWPQLKKSFDVVRKTYVSLQKPAHLTIPAGGGKRPKNIKVILRDTFLLAPAGGASLAALGELLGLPKLEVPPVIDEAGKEVRGIERMDLVLDRHPDLFDEYAVRDALISALWVRTMEQYRVETLELDGGPPVTLSAMSTRSILEVTREAGVDPISMLGKRRDRRKGGGRLKWVRQVEQHVSFLANCFHGARNEAFFHGYTPEGPTFDIDISGAYVMAMGAMKEPDWDAMASTRRLEALAMPDRMAFAHVRFVFPDHVRFPCLPVRVDNTALMFPLECESYCTGVELSLALHMGAKVTVLEGLVVPWASERRPLLEYAKTIAKVRGGFRKGSIEERLTKEIGNSGYGKIAQAVAGWKSHYPSKRSTFNSRKGENDELPPSRISQPGIAAYITGNIRALVSEMLHNVPKGRN